jgi:hypothetical protein
MSPHRSTREIRLLKITKTSASHHTPKNVGTESFDCTQCRMRRTTQRVTMRNGRLIARLLLQSKKLSGEAQSACTALWRKETKVKDM